MYAEYEAAEMRRDEDHDRDMRLAWHVAALAGQAFGGKLPDLKTLLRRKGPPPTVKELREQQLANMKLIAQTRGLRLVEKKAS